MKTSSVEGMNITGKNIQYYLYNPKLTPCKRGRHRSSRTYSEDLNYITVITL